MVSLIVTIILARLLLPEDYGVISLVTIFITIANVFVSDGFGSALIQKKDADEIDFSSVFYSSLVISSILYVVIFFLSDFIAKFYSEPIIGPVLKVLALKIPISAINSVQQSYVSRNMLFRKFFVSTLFGTIISGIVGVLMAYKGFGVWALVAQYLTNTVIDTIVLWFIVKWRPKKVFSIKKVKSLLSYGWKILIQSLLVTLYGNIRGIIIGKVYSSEDLAFYTKGAYYPNLLVVNVDSAMSASLFPAMSKEQQNIEIVKKMTRKSVQLCSYMLCPLLIGFMVCSEKFVNIFLTDKWLPILPFLHIICIALLFRPAETSCLQSIKAVGRSDISLKVDIPIRIVGLLLIFISMFLGLIFVAISEVIVALLGLFIYGIACKKYIGYKIKELFMDFFMNVLISCLMGGFVYLLGYLLNLNMFIELIIQVSSGAIFYLMLSIFTKNQNFLYLFQFIKQNILRKKFNLLV